MNKAAPLFSFSGPSLVGLAATHVDRRCTRFFSWRCYRALRTTESRASRVGPCTNWPVPIVIQETAVSILSRAEFGSTCRHRDRIATRRSFFLGRIRTTLNSFVQPNACLTEGLPSNKPKPQCWPRSCIQPHRKERNQATISLSMSHDEKETGACQQWKERPALSYRHKSPSPCGCWRNRGLHAGINHSAGTPETCGVGQNGIQDRLHSCQSFIERRIPMHR
jgi:hypothetical protein